MEFGIRWNDGYEVTVTMVDERGYKKIRPLRNFGDRQGDAKCFKYFDCPHLTDPQLRLLIKNYDPKVKYIRESGKRFVRQKNEP